MDKEAKEELKEWLVNKHREIGLIKAENAAEQLFKSGKLAGLKAVLTEFCIEER